jgi:hypothetical protein
MKYDGTVLAPVAGPGYEYTYAGPAGDALNGEKDLVVTFNFPTGVGTSGFAGNDTSEAGLTDQNETLNLDTVGVAVQQVRP